MQKNLFEDLEFGDKYIPVKVNSKKLLSKEQKQFNTLTKKVQNLKETIESTNTELHNLFIDYSNNVQPKVAELGRVKIILAHQLHNRRKEVKLTHTQNEKLSYCIWDILDDAFTAVEPNDNDITLYNKYSEEGTYAELLEEDKVAAQQDMADMLKQQFGIKINPADLDENFDIEKMQAQIEEQMQQQFQDYQNNMSKQKKTKKQLDKEAIEAQKEELKNKSLRSIYLSLAKILHPDTSTSEEEKIEKEEMMKKVTQAYNDKNIIDLLQLESQWVQQQSDAVIDTDKIKLYIEILKDRVKDLQFELQLTYQNPRYISISHYPLYNLAYAAAMIEKDAASYQSTIGHTNKTVEKLNTAINLKQTITNCIKEYAPKEEVDNGMYDFDTLMQMVMSKGKFKW